MPPAPAPRPTAEGPRAPSAYTRFIPREEVGSVAAWTPGSFGVERRTGRPDRRAPEATGAPSEAEQAQRLAQAVDAARQAGYRDGYRDGLVALDSFKQSYAQQVSAQVATLVSACQTQLDALQAAIADTVTHTALALARQVVRSELQTHPELIARVAAESVEALLDSARHLVLRLHPDDLALVADGAADALASRGTRLVADPAIERGGCLLESDSGRVDARIATRWQRAVTRFGSTDGRHTPDDDAPAAPQEAA
jgi:flagellar assembly protein FliH